MQVLTPAPADLSPLAELVADEPFWHYPVGPAGRDGVAHLRVWTTTTDPPGHLAVVTETGSAASVTKSAGQIWAELARRYGSSLVLLEHQPTPEDRPLRGLRLQANVHVVPVPTVLPRPR